MPSQKPVFLCQSLFSSKCLEAEGWGTAATDSVGWCFAECLNKTSLWVWLNCFSSHLIYSTSVLKSCRRKYSWPNWIYTNLVPVLNVNIDSREKTTASQLWRKGDKGNYLEVVAEEGEEMVGCAERGAVWGVPCLGKLGSSVTGETCQPPALWRARFNALHQMLTRLTIFISKAVELWLFISLHLYGFWVMCLKASMTPWGCMRECLRGGWVLALH